MDHEARKIARHHLGERLHWIGRGGPTADEWIVQAWPDTGHMIHAQAATVDAAAADCASQLRAAGWSPSHARLEWTREFDDFFLTFHLEKFSTKVWSGKVYSNGTGWAFNDSSGSLHNDAPIPEAEIVRIIAEWCATNLPSLHLPPFPGADNA